MTKNKRAPGAGRKPFARAIKMVTVKLYCDQLPTSSAELRTALDYFRSRAETVQDSSDQHGATAAQKPQS